MTTTISGTNGITLSGSTNQITFNDASTQISHAVPQVTVYTSGSGTYTVPSNTKWLTVEMIGGGGGGAGGGNGGSGGASSQAGSTTFGTCTCTGGYATYSSTNPGAATLGSGFVGVALQGASGGGFSANGPITTYPNGGIGGTSPFGGNGTSNANSGGTAAVANSGSGGGGGGAGAVVNCYGGGGGGAGGYIKAVVTSPAASYSYAVGAGSAGGAAEANGFAGGAGGSGVIIVTAYF